MKPKFWLFVNTCAICALISPIFVMENQQLNSLNMVYEEFSGSTEDDTPRCYIKTTNIFSRDSSVIKSKETSFDLIANDSFKLDIFLNTKLFPKTILTTITIAGTNIPIVENKVSTEITTADNKKLISIQFREESKTYSISGIIYCLNDPHYVDIINSVKDGEEYLVLNTHDNLIHNYYYSSSDFRFTWSSVAVKSVVLFKADEKFKPIDSGINVIKDLTNINTKGKYILKTTDLAGNIDEALVLYESQNIFKEYWKTTAGSELVAKAHTHNKEIYPDRFYLNYSATQTNELLLTAENWPLPIIKPSSVTISGVIEDVVVLENQKYTSKEKLETAVLPMGTNQDIKFVIFRQNSKLQAPELFYVNNDGYLVIDNSNNFEMEKTGFEIFAYSIENPNLRSKTKITFSAALKGEKPLPPEPKPDNFNSLYYTIGGIAGVFGFSVLVWITTSFVKANKKKKYKKAFEKKLKDQEKE